MNTPPLLFWDTETDGAGGFRRPLQQNLLQLAWCVTDATGQVQHAKNHFVAGTTNYIPPNLPHNLTLEFVTTHGVPVHQALEEFLQDVNAVVDAGGQVVAHNLTFDVGVVEHALHTAATHPNAGPAVRAAAATPHGWGSKLPGVCTMRNRAVREAVGARNRAGRVKAPRLEELTHAMVGPPPPNTQWHDAVVDTEMLRRCYLELQKQGII